MINNMKSIPLFLAATLVTLAGCHRAAYIHPERKTIVDAVFASGHTENYDQYTIMSNMEGYVQKAYVVEGDTVRKGQPLFRIENNVQATQVHNAIVNLDFARSNAEQGSPLIQQLQLQIAQAREKLVVDSTNYVRYAKLVTSRAVSVSDFNNAELTYKNSRSSLVVLEKNLADLWRNLKLSVDNATTQYDVQRENNNYSLITSVFAGVVMNVNKKTGDRVRNDDAIAVLATGKVIIKLDIAEDDIRRVQSGYRTEISLNSNKDRLYRGTITKIYPAFNTTDQSFVAEAEFDTVPPHLLNGTQLQANIVIGTKTNALVIPSYYLLNGGFVLLKDQKEKHSVGIGIQTLEWTEITSGLSETDILIQPRQ